MIIRLARKNRFTVIDNTIIEDKTLSWAARALLIYLLSKPDDWKVQVSQLVKAGDLGPDGIYARLKELQRAGYAKHEQRRDHKGRIVGSDWFIADEPQFKGSPDRDIPDMDENRMVEPFSPDLAQPDLAQPDLANPALLSTEYLLRTENTNDAAANARAPAREEISDQSPSGRQDGQSSASHSPADPPFDTTDHDDDFLDRLTGKKPPVNPYTEHELSLAAAIRASGIWNGHYLDRQDTRLRVLQLARQWSGDGLETEELAGLLKDLKAEGRQPTHVNYIARPVADYLQAKKNPVSTPNARPGLNTKNNRNTRSIFDHDYASKDYQSGATRDEDLPQWARDALAE